MTVIPLHPVSVHLNGGWTVGENQLINRHLQDLRMRGRTAATIRARGRLLARLQEALSVPLEEASAADLLAWREGLAVDRDSVRTYVSHARQFYSWLRRTGVRPDDPAEDLPVPPKRKRKARPMPEEHLMIALAGAPPRVRPWLALAADAGLRCKEIAFLRRENVWEHRRPPCLLITAESTKGERIERTVPMTPFLREVLLEHGLPASGFLFRRYDGQPGPNMPWTISGVVNRYLHSAGIPETIHQLRHRYGTFINDLGGDRVTQELLGHQQLDSVQIYTLVSSAQIAEVVSQLPDLRPGRLHPVSDSA
jgi:site-specific recombinase XerD